MRILQAGISAVLAVALMVLGGCSSSAGTVMGKGNIGAPAGTGFLIKTVSNEGRQRKYAVFIPHAYTPDKKWPAIVYLHGIAEGGTGAQHNLAVGLGPEVGARAATFPFIVVFPQSDLGNWDENSPAAADAIAALEQVERDYAVDRGRVILTGVSIGGYGTWAIGAKYKDHFTALVPMCAFSDFKDVDQFADIPVWCFHNTGDPFVMAAGDHAMCDKINAEGGNAKYTEYLALGHDVWVRAYQKDELYQWMLNTKLDSQRRWANSNMADVKWQHQSMAAAPTVVNFAPAALVPEVPHVRAELVSEVPHVQANTPMAAEPDTAAAPPPLRTDGYVRTVW